MKVFLWADEKFTLKLDGEYHGVKSAAVIEDFSPCLIEAFPHSGKLPISFIMDYRPLSHKNVDFYHLNDHIALKLKFQNIYDVGFKLLLQERVKSHGALVTIFTDGLTKIVVETPTHVESVQAPPHIKNYSIETKDSLIIIKSEGCPYLLTVFETTPHLCLKFANFVSEHTINPIFRTKTRIFDIERSTVLCEWNFESINKRPKIIERNCELPYYPTMPERIIKRIFFERILYNLPIEDMLCAQLKQNAAQINGFLGNYTALLPDFLIDDGVYLAYNNCNKPTAKLFDLDIENGLITNIKEI